LLDCHHSDSIRRKEKMKILDWDLNETISNESEPEIEVEVGSVLKAKIIIDRVIYPKNPEPGSWGVIACHIDSNNDILEGILPSSFKSKYKKNCWEFTIKGILPPINLNIKYYFEGFYKEDIKYGKQYDIHQIYKDFKLETNEDKRFFLTAIMPEDKVDRLFLAFEDPIVPLKNRDIDALCAVRGVGNATALKLIKTYENRIADAKSIVLLEALGLTSNIIFKLQNKFKSVDTIYEIIMKNPYALINEHVGFGFTKADNLALSNGIIEPESPKRIAAYIKYLLETKAENEGHSWIPVSELKENILGIAKNLSQESLRDYLLQWIYPDVQNGWLYLDRTTQRIGLMYFRMLETQIATELLRLQRAVSFSFTNEQTKQAIEESEREIGFEYTDEQKIGIAKCLNSNVSLVVGSAGVGKTYSMLPVIKADSSRIIKATSLSGKASSNLGDTIGIDGYTIHRLLEYSKGVFQRNENNPIVADIVILDELSLIGGEIFLDLLRAIPYGCKLIMLGDHKQFESIGFANLLKDCMESNVIPLNYYTKIHRQAAKSGIIINSLQVSNKEHIIPIIPINEVRGELKDFKVVTYGESKCSQENILEQFKELYINQKISYKDISVLTPLRTRGDMNCYILNSKIQQIVNGLPTPTDIEIKGKDGVFTLRTNDKILIRENNYDILSINGEKAPLFNGNVGYVVEINQKEKYILLDMVQQGLVQVTMDAKHIIDLGYCMSIHASQGTGFPYVIVGIDSVAYILLSKELIYTALTRAKKHCVLVGQIAAIRDATRISRVSIKQTWLKELLQEFSQKEEIERNLTSLSKYLHVPAELLEINISKEDSNEIEWED